MWIFHPQFFYFQAKLLGYAPSEEQSCTEENNKIEAKQEENNPNKTKTSKMGTKKNTGITELKLTSILHLR